MSLKFFKDKMLENKSLKSIFEVLGSKNVKVKYEQLNINRSI